MKNIFKKTMAMTIVLVLIISTVANAVSFTDISNHWAKDYILKVAGNNLVAGYKDGTFKPEANVTVLESLIMMSRLYEIDEDIKEQIIDKYTPVIEKIPNSSNYDWAFDNLCIAIELGIVSESGLSNMISEKTISNPAKKEEIAILLTKAMMLGDKAKNLKSYTLPFNDVNDISTAARPYIYIMYDEGIVQGDNNKNINPKSNITRAVIATMLDRAYDHIIKNKVEPDFDGYSPKVYVNGIITEVSVGNVESHIYIKKDDGSSSIVRINNSTKIFLNDRTTTIEKLSENMIVTCKIDDLRLAEIVEADNKTKIVEGKLYLIAFSAPQKITMEDSKNNRVVYDVAKDAKVYLDGEEILLKNLNKNDMATVFIKDGSVIEIRSVSRYKEYSGKITNIDYSKIPIKITVKNSKEDPITFEYNSKVEITRNKDKSSLDQIRIGDEVTITTEYEEMIQMNTIASEAELSGTIKEIIIDTKPRIKIVDIDGNEKEYSVSNNIKINIGSKNSTIYDLRIGYFVYINTLGDEIVTIEAEQIQTAKVFTGKVVYLNTDDKIIMMQSIKENGQTELVHLKVTNSTKIFNTQGNTKYLKDIVEGTNIITTVTSEGGEYIAVSIMIQ